ncbi:MAG TPA: SDR family NAD(P)-dependent oxidoreductase [Pseudomonadales bacterium]|nr:SDR family NAD(P)-dependent oxidoreductase [Pseudomonadales bacterium]
MKKSALITGGTGGFGLALTRHLVTRGWQVFAADCDTAGLEALTKQDGVTPVFIDVTKTESVEAALAEVKKHVQQLDAVINFAGILRVGAMIEMDEKVVQQVLDINLMGTWRVNKAFFPLLKHGRIVNVSSETGWHTASPFNGAYAMSKYGIEAYSDALRRELSIYNIPVIKIQPGPFKTNMVANTVGGFQLAAKNSQLYSKQLEHFGDLVFEANKKAGDPDYLSEVIYHALTVKKPKTAYSVKADPGRSFLEWLPVRISDSIFKKILSR